MKIKSFILNLTLLSILAGCAPTDSKESEKTAYWIPQIDGEWWQVTNTYPEIAPYEYQEGDNKVCDFTIFKATDGTWQCIACVRGNNYPGANRFLYRWQADQLTDKMWEEKGVFQATGTDTEKKDGWGYIWNKELYPDLGKLQAPHCIIENEKYYFFYNNASGMCKISDDGLAWKDLKNDEGNYHFFEMGRDLMLFDDRNQSGNWIIYYTTGGKFPQYMAARTCKTLTGTWSDEKMVYDGWSNTRNPIYRNEFAESPFVVKYNGMYYLFAQLHVFISENPLNFKENFKVADLESSYYDERVWAPEIIIDGDQYFICAYRPTGLWMAKLKWIETTEICKYD